MDERRSKPRLSVHLDAVWHADEERHSARITDLSEGGCYLDTVGEVMVGEIVAFRVLFPDGDWLYLEGEVRHHRHGFHRGNSGHVRVRTGLVRMGFLHTDHGLFAAAGRRHGSHHGHDPLGHVFDLVRR